MAQLLDTIRQGVKDHSVTIRIVDSDGHTPETGVEHNTAGIALWYRRQGGAKVAITAVALSALTDAHADGGIEHIGDGEYRLDLPDAATASGADHVDIGGTVTGMIVQGGRVRLAAPAGSQLTAVPSENSTSAGPQFFVDGDIEGPFYGVYLRNYGGLQIFNRASAAWETFDAVDSITNWANYLVTATNVRYGGTDTAVWSLPDSPSEPDVASAGEPRQIKVLLFNRSTSMTAGFIGGLDYHFEADSWLPAVGRAAESARLGEVELERLANLVSLSTSVSSVTSQTQLVLTAGSTVNDAYKGMIARIGDASNSGYPSYRNIAGYTGATKTLQLESAPGFTVESSDSVAILPCHPFLQDILRKGIAYDHTSDSGVKSVTVTKTS